MGKHLTSDQVSVIRSRLIANESYLDIAKTFDVTTQRIRDIASGKSYDSYCSRQTEITARHKLGTLNDNQAFRKKKLADYRVEEIRALVLAWEPTAWIAEEYGVSEAHIKNINCEVLVKRYAAGLPSFTPMAVRDLWDM